MIATELKEAGLDASVKLSVAPGDDDITYYVSIDHCLNTNVMSINIDGEMLSVWDRRVQCDHHEMHTKRTAGRFDIREPDCFERLLTLLKSRL